MVMVVRTEGRRIEGSSNLRLDGYTMMTLIKDWALFGKLRKINTVHNGLSSWKNVVIISRSGTRMCTWLMGWLLKRLKKVRKMPSTLAVIEE